MHCAGGWVHAHDGMLASGAVGMRLGMTTLHARGGFECAGNLAGSGLGKAATTNKEYTINVPEEQVTYTLNDLYGVARKKEDLRLVEEEKEWIKVGIFVYPLLHLGRRQMWRKFVFTCSPRGNVLAAAVKKL